MESLTDVQIDIVSFALSSGQGSDSVAFQDLLVNHSIDIHDVIIFLDDLQSKITSFLVLLDGEL